MKNYRFDVVIVGAGPAGVTAAGALAGSGISVALIETAVYTGAENWSGCVYFAENLARDDCFGRAAVENAPFERRVVRRGTFVHNSIDEVGVALSDPAAFADCYTVLRPLYDPYFANLAREKGAVLITDTTVLSLIRKDGRVVGVQTDRGPLSAGVVFIAEGDASHLVAAERLERVPDPHYLQGVKAVLSLPTREIDRRFGLGSADGAAYEYLVRNPAIGGRTAALNIGAFLYTNRDSLSLGYVVPLENLRKNGRGDHGRLFEWLRGLPSIAGLTDGAALTSYGTKIIRSGGWRDRPVLIADGLAVGGATACLGIDLPFPNFTGPASATGLYFARAVKSLLAEGKSFDAKHLDEAYRAPLMDSVYGRNARALARWPGYFSRSTVLFGRTADVICGSARFLATGTLFDAARFLRGQALSPRALRELVTDMLRTVSSLGLGRHLLATLLSPVTFGSWVANSFRREKAADPRLSLIMDIGGKAVDATALPWPVGKLVRRTFPSLAAALTEVYSNDGKSMDGKLRRALREIARSLSVTDLALLPLYGMGLALAAAGTAVWDAIRYYLLKIPAAKLLAEPVMAYREALRKTRDLDSVRPFLVIETKLATNTSRTGSIPHIRALWPPGAERHSDAARSSLWWICPARVYSYDAPLAGRGRITVNWENCIKCESCWRAEPTGVLWGRFTDHRLIYRPVSGALPVLLASLKEHAATLPLKTAAANTDTLPDSPQLVHARNAAAAFREAVAQLPAAADAGRLSWPAALGTRLTEKLAALEGLLRSGGHAGAAAELKFERDALGLRIREGKLYHALYAVSRIEQRLRPASAASPTPEAAAIRPATITAEEISKLFPDRVVKQWEETPVPEEWAVKLRDLVREHRSDGSGLVRSLASVSPALGLIAGHQLRGLAIMDRVGVCAVDADGMEITSSSGGATIRGTLSLVPSSASTAIALLSGGKAYVLPLAAPGVTVTATPAIGFRAAGLSTVAVDCSVPAKDIVTLTENVVPRSTLHLGIALGAVEYLSRRAKEHALGRIQFPGQMLDTEGRDGIAKLGSVKALVSRTEAWRLLLEMMYDAALLAQHSALRTPNSALELLCSSLASLAFGPEAGCPAYDAGQVFGGFAYSEDDLLSRSYRDSALFRFLEPGHGAAERLTHALAGMPLERACSSELGRLDTVTGAPLDGLIARWRETAAAWAMLPVSADRRLSGDAAALLLGIRGLIVGIGERLDAGRSPETEAASADVLLGLADDSVAKAFMSAGRGTVAPTATFPSAPDTPRVPLDIEYEDFCSRPGPPHRSGLFLRTVFDRSPRYVPEMQLHDFWLRIRWASLADWFRQNCRDRDPGGIPFERRVEQAHSLPPEVLAAVREKKWLVTYVPRQLDGLGWRKADYYVLNSAAGSFGDASLCLLIMASTSIGTTPVLLGLEDDIPRARKELEPLAHDASRLAEIGGRLDRIIASFDHPDPGRIRRDFTALMDVVDSRLRRTSVVKYLSANFLRAFYGAGVAGQRGDFSGFMAGLREAARLFRPIAPDVRAALDELPRRERSHRLFLQRLGHGGVSAFALTEPTAGSDSGGVRTTARLDRAALTPLPDGRWSFFLGSGDRDQRFLIDADRVVFTPAGMAYRTPDDTVCAVRFDRFPRSYSWQGQDREFHDIGQVRATGDGPVYEFYRLTGAKMWITNASAATQFSLFARAPEGVTGFMVDRHAEGLVVGADERKMGQRGSPTNEIALDDVRVPREAIIGFEGHGQVNALETLNVGRCGLAVVAGSLMRKLMDEARRDVPASARRDTLLGEASAVLFGSESLAYYLVGLFDRPHESVRMESAIAKQVCSEDLHEFLTLVEQAYGPAGQTEKYLLEKARRDSRILNIYEGTNEVQRFLILRDVISMAGEWPELPERLEERPADDAARTLARWKNLLRKHVLTAAKKFGDAAWSDAMLQPALFPLAEMAGEVLRLECVLYRREWLETHADRLGAGYAGPMLEAGMRAGERTVVRLEHMERRFRTGWTVVAAGLDMPEVHAADAAFGLAAGTEKGKASPSGMMASLPARILCILRPVADLSPAPRLIDGTLAELVWTGDPHDLAALDQVMALKGADGTTVSIDVLMPGGPEQEHLLYCLAGPADRLVRLDTVSASSSPLAEAVRTLEVSGSYDLIVMGASSLDGAPAPGPFLAGLLGRAYEVRERIDGVTEGIIGISSTSRPTRWDIGTLIAAQEKDVIVLASDRDDRSSAARFEPAAVAKTETIVVTSAAGAAEHLRSFASAMNAAKAPEYPATVNRGELPAGPAVWAVLDAGDRAAGPALFRAARMAADHTGKKACALIAAPDSMHAGLLGLARMNGADAACCISTGAAALSPAGKRGILQMFMKAAGEALFIAGPGWDGTFGYAAGELTVSAGVIAGATGIRADAGGVLTFLSHAYDGRLARVSAIGSGMAFITVAPELDLPLPAARGFTATMLPLRPEQSWVAPLPPEPALTLGRAEVIIDIGYGVRDKSGMELALELKQALERIGLAPMLGATRKVTQDLKLLPLEAQIGQTGVRVNPKVIICLGISGAPQHIDWIGTRADVICFNKDPDAPLMQLNLTRPAPRVHPIAGDLFVTVRELIEKLK